MKYRPVDIAKRIGKRLLTIEGILFTALLWGLSRKVLTFRNWDEDLQKVWAGAILLNAILAPHLRFSGWPTFAARLAIIFDFCAGFLLAPELIGDHRIVKAQDWLQGKLNKIASWWHRASHLGTSESPREIIWGAIIFTWVAFVFQYGWLVFDYYDWIDHLLSFIVISIAYATAAVAGWKYFGGRLVGAIKGVLLLFLSITFAWLIVPWVLLCVFLLELFKFFAGKLTGNKRLRSYMVVTGIIVFISGKIIDFIATFF